MVSVARPPAGIVPSAQRIPEISYEEMLEMAALGAKVLQARSVEFAKKFGGNIRNEIVFRTMHTIKGTCGFLGFHHLEALTHVGEDLLGALPGSRCFVAYSRPGRDDGATLVAPGFDNVKQQRFYRPLGGGIEFIGHVAQRRLARGVALVSALDPATAAAR